jgi:hypothetical protein
LPEYELDFVAYISSYCTEPNSFFNLDLTVLYYTVLYYTILFCTVLHCTVPSLAPKWSMDPMKDDRTAAISSAVISAMV